MNYCILWREEGYDHGYATHPRKTIKEAIEQATMELSDINGEWRDYIFCPITPPEGYTMPEHAIALTAYGQGVEIKYVHRHAQSEGVKKMTFQLMDPQHLPRNAMTYMDLDHRR